MEYNVLTTIGRINYDVINPVDEVLESPVPWVITGIIVVAVAAFAIYKVNQKNKKKKKDDK